MRQAAQQALEALEQCGLDDTHRSYEFEHVARIALRAALAQQEQEPVAWVELLKDAEQIVRSKPLWKKFIDGTPLANDIAVWMADFAQKHAHPPRREWQSLSEEETRRLSIDCYDGLLTDPLILFARAIEAKLKEKNND
jgi:hypothetical protein